MQTQIIDQKTLDGLSPAARRALIRRRLREQNYKPYTAEVFFAFRCGIARWADVEGISDAEIARYADVGRRQIIAGRFEEAKKVFEYLAGIDPVNPLHVLALGTIALETHENEAALAFFELAVLTNGSDLGAHAGKAIAFFRLGKMQEAKEQIERALAIDPEGSQALTVQLAKEVLQN